MTPIQIIAQIFGIFAMAFNIGSYQGKKQGTVIALQLVGGCLFAVNFLLLGAWVGGILNIIAVVRAVLFLYLKLDLSIKRDRLREEHRECLREYRESLLQPLRSLQSTSRTQPSLHRQQSLQI